MVAISTKEQLHKDALDYHELPIPGKLSINVTKSTDTQKDLALAYTPGVAEPVRAIASSPEEAYRYTAKGNLVAVITDGTAVLGLGDVGPLASKPVMEGKAVLFKKFANVDVFDLEVAAKTTQDFIDTVVNIAPTFGGINLEDIKAPQCFAIEQALLSCLEIPVFHDDQHGTAIVVAAGLLNAIELQGKDLTKVKIVCLGAGAAGIATMNLLLSLGARIENIVMLDSKGVIHSDRNDLNQYKLPFARKTQQRTLVDALQDSDIFIGVSKANLLTPDLLHLMAAKPIVFALANPDPEILPDQALAVRADLIMATGRSDFPNQVNNVLCFPYIFRGALDVRAQKINQEMMIAAVQAIRKLAKDEVPESVLNAYGLTKLTFGPDYILPKPLDPRLLSKVASAVANAAMTSGVSALP